MPVLKIQTNKQIEPNELKAFLTRTSSTIARMLGKPERYVMVLFEHNADMLFDSSDAPLAYLELKSIGLPNEQTSEYSSTLCNLLDEGLRIPPDRIYIEFNDAQRHLWGWNGRTF
jgi:phenylpyruvate tautomerase PptA (4-oxalocrotonate tautomerase family)